MYGHGVNPTHRVLDGDVYQPHHSVVRVDRYELESGRLNGGLGRHDVVEVGGGQKRQYADNVIGGTWHRVIVNPPRWGVSADLGVSDSIE
jgi:hypothetical protein